MKRVLILALALAITVSLANAGPGGEKSQVRNNCDKNAQIDFASMLTEAPLPKEQYWPYGSSERRAWETRGYNQWGGHDLWCISPMYAICPLWDWKTIYPPDKAVDDIPGESRCAAWGDGLVRSAAAESEIPLPTDLPFPGYTEKGFDE